MTMMNEVQVYTKDGCGHCQTAKDKLKELNIKFREINIFDEGVNASGEDELMQARRAQVMTTTVPQIYMGSYHLGGCDSLLSSLESGVFWKLVREYHIDVELFSNAAVEGCVPRKTVSITIQDITPEPTEPLNSLRFRPHLQSLLPSYKAPQSPAELSQTLYKVAQRLVDHYSSITQKMVSYEMLQSSEDLVHYILLSTELNLISVDEIHSWSASEKICFFVNLYNALVIHGKTISPQRSSPIEDKEAYLKETFDFFVEETGVFYKIGSFPFALDDIEHGVLRANQPHPKEKPAKHTYFDSDDHRSLFSLTEREFDPRIHFVLNCGAKSCPAITFLSLENMERSLTLAMRVFLEQEVSLQDDGGRTGMVILPKLLSWYGCDFGETLEDQLKKIADLLKGSSDTHATDLHRLFVYLASPQFPEDKMKFRNKSFLGKYEVFYRDYDWTLNQDEQRK
jgi:glutaredoxin